MSPLLTPQAHNVGWIYVMQAEYVIVVACEILDEEYAALPTSSPHDNNVYMLGRIGHHNVVIACQPKGEYGLTSGGFRIRLIFCPRLCTSTVA